MPFKKVKQENSSEIKLEPLHNYPRYNRSSFMIPIPDSFNYQPIRAQNSPIRHHPYQQTNHLRKLLRPEERSIKVEPNYQNSAKKFETSAADLEAIMKDTLCPVGRSFPRLLVTSRPLYKEPLAECFSKLPLG